METKAPDPSTHVDITNTDRASDYEQFAADLARARVRVTAAHGDATWKRVLALLGGALKTTPATPRREVEALLCEVGSLGVRSLEDPLVSIVFVCHGATREKKAPKARAQAIGGVA